MLKWSQDLHWCSNPKAEKPILFFRDCSLEVSIIDFIIEANLFTNGRYLLENPSQTPKGAIQSTSAERSVLSAVALAVFHLAPKLSRFSEYFGCSAFKLRGQHMERSNTNSNISFSEQSLQSFAEMSASVQQSSVSAERSA